MDYEQKYKEALELARDYYKANLKLNKADENVILEDIFPELAESEDEKTRKALISFLKSPFVNENITDEKVAPWLAWLEKQGTSYTKRDVDDAYVEGMAFAKNELKKQGEQKPSDMSIKEKAHQIARETSKYYDPLLSKESWCEMAALDMASWLEKQGNNPAWTEADDEEFEIAISILKDAGQYSSADWLLTLKQRIGG